MATLNIRQVNDEVVRLLKLRAAENHRSLESEIRHILERAATDDMAHRRRAFLDLSRELRRPSDGRFQTPSHLLIRQDRDEGHGPA